MVALEIQGPPETLEPLVLQGNKDPLVSKGQQVIEDWQDRQGRLAKLDHLDLLATVDNKDQLEIQDHKEIKGHQDHPGQMDYKDNLEIEELQELQDLRDLLVQLVKEDRQAHWAPPEIQAHRGSLEQKEI